MKKNTITFLSVASLLLCLAIVTSCKKQDSLNKKIVLRKEVDRQKAIIGTWKQTDLQLGVTAELGGNVIPAGTSMYDLAPLLGPPGQAILATKNNFYTFTDSTYSFDGLMLDELLFPVAGASGKWKLVVHNRVILQLIPQAGEANPHWINDMTKTFFSLQVWVKIPGVATAPLNIIMEKSN